MHNIPKTVSIFNKRILKNSIIDKAYNSLYHNSFPNIYQLIRKNILHIIHIKQFEIMSAKNQYRHTVKH